MSPVTHFLIGWVVATSANLDRRERAIVALAGVAPDLDGIGIVAEVLTRNSSHPLTWFSDYHHLLGHNIVFAAVVTLVAFLLARQRWKTAALACLSFHLHLFCDVIGARGPDGYQWPVPYLLPFSHRWAWEWSGQWPLNGWPNMLITVAALAFTFYIAWKKGYSPIEIVSPKADAAFVATIRQRFPMIQAS